MAVGSCTDTSRADELQCHRVRTLARGDLFKAHEDFVRAGLQVGLERNAVRDLMIEMLLAMNVLAVEPHIGGTVGGEDKGHALRGGADELRVRPRAQIVANVMEHGQVNEMVIATAHVFPIRLKIADPGRLRLSRHLRDTRLALVIMLRDLQFVVRAGVALEIVNAGGLRSGDEPIVDVAVFECVIEVRDGHEPPVGVRSD